MLGLLFHLEEIDNQLHQEYVRHDDEQRREHDGTGGGTAYAFGTAARPHALEAGDHSDDQTKNGGLEGGWKNVVERDAVKAI
jgi:hypothetical protein